MKRANVFWFTGLSGSGKTTVAEAVKLKLERDGYGVLILDGDDIRKRLHKDIGFTEEDIKKNNEWIVGLCKKYRSEYDVILVPIISPYRSSRENAKRELDDCFYEIYFSADLNTVIKRDVKGLYKKAQQLEITNLIGFSPGTIYEAPEHPDLIIRSGLDPEEKSINDLYIYIIKKLS